MQYKQFLAARDGSQGAQEIEPIRGEMNIERGKRRINADEARYLEFAGAAAIQLGQPNRVAPLI